MELIAHYPSRHTTSFQRLYDVYTTSATSYRRRIDVETTSCAYWDKVGQSLLHSVACITKKAALLQIRAGITYWGKSCYKVGEVMYYKVGQSLLQDRVGIIKWVNFITKWGNCYRKGRHIFRTLGQMETHVY